MLQEWNIYEISKKEMKILGRSNILGQTVKNCQLEEFKIYQLYSCNNFAEFLRSTIFFSIHFLLTVKIELFVWDPK